MQIFERVKRQNFTASLRDVAIRRPVIATGSQGLGIYRKAQNLIEFIFVIPILLVTTLVIFEVGLFWQDLNSVYSLNNEINANAALSNIKNMSMGTTCTAASEAFQTLQEKDSIISMNNPSYGQSVIDGQEPFALYLYASTNQIAGKPQISLWVDCRNPFENGVTTQVEFFHKTLVMRATIPRFDGGDPIVVIPDNIYIASPKLNTIRHY